MVSMPFLRGLVYLCDILWAAILAAFLHIFVIVQLEAFLTFRRGFPAHMGLKVRTRAEGRFAVGEAVGEDTHGGVNGVLV